MLLRSCRSSSGRRRVATRRRRGRNRRRGRGREGACRRGAGARSRRRCAPDAAAGGHDHPGENSEAGDKDWQTDSGTQERRPLLRAAGGRQRDRRYSARRRGAGGGHGSFRRRRTSRSCVLRRGRGPRRRCWGWLLRDGGGAGGDSADGGRSDRRQRVLRRRRRNAARRGLILVGRWTVTGPRWPVLVRRRTFCSPDWCAFDCAGTMVSRGERRVGSHNGTSWRYGRRRCRRCRRCRLCRLCRRYGGHDRSWSCWSRHGRRARTRRAERRRCQHRCLGPGNGTFRHRDCRCFRAGRSLHRDGRGSRPPSRHGDLRSCRAAGGATSFRSGRCAPGQGRVRERCSQHHHGGIRPRSPSAEHGTVGGFLRHDLGGSGLRDRRSLAGGLLGRLLATVRAGAGACPALGGRALGARPALSGRALGARPALSAGRAIGGRLRHGGRPLATPQRAFHGRRRLTGACLRHLGCVRRPVACVRRCRPGGEGIVVAARWLLGVVARHPSSSPNLPRGARSSTRRSMCGAAPSVGRSVRRGPPGPRGPRPDRGRRCWQSRRHHSQRPVVRPRQKPSFQSRAGPRRRLRRLRQYRPARRRS